jgi:type IX secretion system PorP/SprF family membrane protein
MKRIYAIIISLPLLAGAFQGFAQQEAMFTHYMFNMQSLNPAYAGSRDAFTFSALHRSQWVGFDGAPVTQNITMHTPILEDIIGIGLSAVNDKIGPFNNSGVYADIAYRIKLNRTDRLSLGIKGGGNIMSVNMTGLTLNRQGDMVFQSNLRSNFLPNFGFGAFYSGQKFYLGASTPAFLENDIFNSLNGIVSAGYHKLHIYLSGGTKFKLDRDLEFLPSFITKIAPGAPIQGEVTGRLLFNKKFSMGAMIRTGDGVGALVGFNISDEWRMGYSYDLSIGNPTFKHNRGTHEIMLTYDFYYNKKRYYKNPRW